MPCYRPIPAVQRGPGQPVQLWPPRDNKGKNADELALPCGHCIGCKTQRALQWAQRCQHEASQYSHNIFITLTYDDANLPHNGHLDAVAFQKFLKRLRKSAQDRPDAYRRDPAFNTRFFGCGEYGEQNGRPHYHAIIFNADYAERRKVARDLYESEELSRLWPYGQARYGPATPAAANYIAQYSLKKQTQPKGWTASDGYNGEGYYAIDENGEEHWQPKPAPFLRMSLKPGIGSEWLTKFQYDLQNGYLVADGHRQSIPRTYREKLKLLNPDLSEDIAVRAQSQRGRNHEALAQHNHPDRLHASEVIHRARKTLLENRNL